jgi:hypothetical protein
MRLRSLFLAPWRDAMFGMERVVAAEGGRGMALALLGVLASWWVYVPVHELMHAWGCTLAGGTVTRLEIDEVYGAAGLARVFPFVSPGSAYAGRLSGFDTHDSDFVYLATVFFPFTLTLFPGVLALQGVIHARRPRAFFFGAAVPWALAPFVSLVGDYYELGSIMVSRAAAGWLPDAPSRWRSDDLVLLGRQLFGGGDVTRWTDVAGVSASLLVGTALTFATYAAGAAIATRCGSRPAP